MSTGEVMEVTGLTYRQLQYWDEKGVLSPSSMVDGRRQYVLHDLRRAHILARMREKGIRLRHCPQLLRDIERELGTHRSPVYAIISIRDIHNPYLISVCSPTHVLRRGSEERGAITIIEVK
jgi:DNA-binding transcriptional MerR regulator